MFWNREAVVIIQMGPEALPGFHLDSGVGECDEYRGKGEKLQRI